MQGFHELLLEGEMRQAEALLSQSGLEMPTGVTFALGYFADNVLAGAGFLAHNTLCGICVSKSLQGSGLAVSIVDRLVQQALLEGRRHLLLFTKPLEAPKFQASGFQLLAAADSAALLEWGSPDYAAWLRTTKRQAGQGEAAPDAGIGAVVMNANPFTLGHRHLALEARKLCGRLLVFIVQEDASVFPFATRFDLAQKGLAGISGVVALPGGAYMVSRASFPSYFTGKNAHSQAHAELDCTLFARRIAPDLGISLRVVGKEPFSPVTDCYNKAMQTILPRYGIQCREIPRLAVAGKEISASQVRALLQGGLSQAALEQVRTLTPDSTLAFLLSQDALPILHQLQQGAQRASSNSSLQLP